MNLHSLSAVNYTLSGWLRCHFYMYQTKLLKKAMTMLDNEKQIRKDERERTLAERVPALEMSGLSLQDLQVHLSLKHFNTHFQVSINSLLLHPNDLFLPNVPRAASNYFYLQRFWGIRHFLNSNTIKVNVTEFEVHKELKKNDICKPHQQCLLPRTMSHFVQWKLCLGLSLWLIQILQ